MWLELLTLILGIAFGFFHHGKEDYKGLFKNSVIAGIAMSIIFVLVSMFLLPGGLTISLGILGAVGLFLIIVIFVILFIIGAFIGDRIERATQQ